MEPHRQGALRCHRKTDQPRLAPDAEVGDYVLVHVGFALEKIDPDEATRIWEILRETEELRDIEAHHRMPLHEILRRAFGIRGP